MADDMTLRRRVPILVMFLLGVACAPAPVPLPADESALRFFTGARLILGNGDVLDEGALLIQGDRIAAVGTADELTALSDANIIDLSGKTVMPALVNTHAHLGWEAYERWGSEQFTRENLVDHLHRHAYYGVGTIISTGSDIEEIALEVRQAQRAGGIGGARYLVSPGLGTPGGGPNPRFTDDAGWWGVNEVTAPDGARDVVRRLAERGVGILKIWVDARDRRRGAEVKLSPEIYTAVIDEALVRDIRVIAHATTLEDHKRLVEAGVRRFIHMPYDTDVDDEYLAMVAARNVYIVPTLGMVTRGEPYRRPVFDDPFFQEQVPARVVTTLREAAADPGPGQPSSEAAQERARVIRDNFARLRDHIILGTDAGAVGDFFGYADHLEIELFVELGMTPSEAIVASTSRAARAFGLDETGALEAGRSADFVVLDANPLDDIMNSREVADVYVRGARVDRDALRDTWTQ